MANAISPPESLRLPPRLPTPSRVRREKPTVSQPTSFIACMAAAGAAALWMILSLPAGHKGPMLGLFAIATLLASAILLQRKGAAMILGYMLLGAALSVAHIYATS